MRKIIPIFFVAFIFSIADLPAQILTETPHILPHTIFVGDRGRLVVPLGAAFSGVAPFVLEGPIGLPETQDLVLWRVELDRRGAISRLLVDFVPFATGTLYLPPLGFLFSYNEEMALPELSVQVASILHPSNMALSQPALPLAVPGTSLLVYGTGILVLLLLSLAVAFSMVGPRYFRDFWRRLHVRYRIYTMMRFLRRLKQEYCLEKEPNPGHYLTTLSAKLREFLTFYTGFNCQSLTAMEFLSLPLDTVALEPSRLSTLFRAWDTLRFSGQFMGMHDLFKAINDVNELIITIAEAEKRKRAEAASSQPKTPVSTPRKHGGGGEITQAKRGSRGQSKGTLLLPEVSMREG